MFTKTHEDKKPTSISITFLPQKAVVTEITNGCFSDKEMSGKYYSEEFVKNLLQAKEDGLLD